MAMYASDPAFLAEAKKLLRAEELEAITPLLDKCVIVTNLTGEYVFGFTVLYTYPDKLVADGGEARLSVSPTAIAADRRHMAEPGARFVVTPISNLFWSIKADGGRIVWPIFDSPREAMLKWYSENFAGQRVVVSLDSLVYEDGTLTGPDQAGRIKILNDRLRARRDLQHQVAGLRSEELREYLERTARDTTLDAYGLELGGQAQAYLDILNREGEASFNRKAPTILLPAFDSFRRRSE